jgi:hypothetical protein
VQSANLLLKTDVKSQQLLRQAFAALLDTWLCEVSLEKEGKYDFEVKEAGAEHGHGSQHTHIFHEVVAALAEEDKLTQDDREFWQHVLRALTYALEAEDKLKQDEMGFWNDVCKIPTTIDPLHEIRTSATARRGWHARSRSGTTRRSRHWESAHGSANGRRTTRGQPMRLMETMRRLHRV